MSNLYASVVASCGTRRGAAAAAVAVAVLCFAITAVFLVNTQQGYDDGVIRSSSNQALARYDFEALARTSNFSEKEIENLVEVLSKAALEDKKTVFIAPLNKAWAVEGSMLDIFLESFRVGEGTSHLVDHVVIVALDQVAYERCLAVHKHCFELRTEGVDFSGEQRFMSEDYLKMVKRRLYFLGIVLQLGFNFVFTAELLQDVDIMWFRPPFQHYSRDAEIEVACDRFNGNSTDLNNKPNMGLVHVRSSGRTIRLYKYWHEQNEAHPSINEQDIFNNFKHSPEFHEFDLKIRFIPTEYFSGFCQVSKDLEKVCTMHANCCIGLHKKIADLKLILEDWKLFKSMTPQESREQRVHFRAPQHCLK